MNPQRTSKETSKLLALAEENVKRIQKLQVMDKESPHFGGVVRRNTGLPSAENAGGTPADLCTLVSLYLHPDSRHHNDKALIPHIEAAATYMCTAQGRDGLISMDYCNFDSPPDTAFVVVGMAELYTLLAESGEASLNQTKQMVLQFLTATEPGLVKGGVHTPNHRWVMAAALMWLHRISGSTAAKERAKQWLAEGIDCSEDGEWTERSNGIYNVVCDIMFIQMAQLFPDDKLLEPVRRNLENITSLIHPNGLLVTDYSTRQDRMLIHYVDAYYLIYRLMAAKDRNPEWAWWSDFAAAHMGEHSEKAFGACTHALMYHLRYPEEMGLADVARKEPKKHYTRHIRRVEQGFNVIRKRNMDASLTLVGESDTIGSFVYGDARMVSMRPTLGFFGKAVVKPPAWQAKPDGSYTATTEIVAPYFGPLAEINVDELDDNVDRLNMYKSHRREVDICTLLTTIQLQPVESGFDLTWSTEANWPVFAQFTMMFGPEGELQQDLGLRRLEGSDYLFEGNRAVYRFGPWVIEATKEAPDKPLHTLQVVRGDVPRNSTTNLLVNSLAGTDVVLKVRGYKSGERR